ncbi:MAG: hypothetical protein J5785_03920 [Spirochaetales bacterium]|nr:hypothetical protein [Spirochaetales bacterium]
MSEDKKVNEPEAVSNEQPKSTYADGEKQPLKWYQGRSGKVSAKRVAGLFIIMASAAVAVLSIIYNYAEAEDILWPMLSAGTVLLGSGVLERFGNTDKTTKK